VSKVSVIVNCKNGEKYLEKSLQSIFDQNYDNFEIIFWDNKSSDKSLEIAEGFDKRLIIFKSEEPLSLGEARNRAINKASGDFICFLDTDDTFLENRITSQIEALRDEKYNIAIGGYDLIDSSGQITSRKTLKYGSGKIFERFLRRYDVNLQTILIKTSLIHERGISFDNKLEFAEDMDFFMQLAYDQNIFVVKEPIAQYRIHPNQLTKRTYHLVSEEFKIIFDRLEQKYQLSSNLPKSFSYANNKLNFYDYINELSEGKRIAAFRRIYPVIFEHWHFFLLAMLLFAPIKTSLLLKLLNR